MLKYTFTLTLLKTPTFLNCARYTLAYYKNDKGAILKT
jgi:hypothetical protein